MSFFSVFREDTHMRIRARKVAALLMAVTLLSVSGNPAVTTAAFGAEDVINAAGEVPGETVPAVDPAPAADPNAAPAQDPAPAPAPEPATEPAPATEAAPAATEAPTEPQTAAQTEAPPVTEAAPAATEAPAAETQAAPETTETQAQTQAQTASGQAATEAAQTEAKKEKETDASDDEEEEGKTRKFKADALKGTIEVVLPKKKGVSKKGTLVVEGSMYVDNKANRSKVDKVILGKQRVITGGRFCNIYLKDGDQTIPIPEGTRITYTRSEGLGLQLEPQRQYKTHIFNVSGDSAQEIGADISVNGDLQITGFSFDAPKNLKTFGLIAEENRANDGAAVSRGSVISGIGEAASFGAVAQSVNGVVTEDSISNNTGILDSLAGYSTTLANATSGSDAAVVTVYTDGDGNVLTNSSDAQDPMKAVLNESGQIDVSSRMVVVNYVVTNPGVGHISLPHYDIVADGTVIDKDSAQDKGGRFVVTATSIRTGTDGNFALQPFTGEVSIARHAVGTYLVPNGTISTAGRLVGAAYARSVNIAKDRRIIKATVSAEYAGSEAAEAEMETEDETEAETEDETEAETEDDTEAETEAETETETEAETETETKAEAKAETETETETETESESEPSTEDKGEAVLFAAAEEPEETMSVAKVDETEPFSDANAKEGGLDTIYKVIRAFKVSSPEETATSVVGATLALYNKSEIKFTYKKTVDSKEKTVEVTIPANTRIADWKNTKAGEVWDLSPYIKVQDDGTYLTTAYEIREEVVPPDPDSNTRYTKAWNYGFTCKIEAGAPDPIVTILENKFDVDQSKFDSTNNIFYIVDPKVDVNNPLVYNIGVHDIDITTPATDGYYLPDIPIQIVKKGDTPEQDIVVAAFSSIKGMAPIDLSVLKSCFPSPSDPPVAQTLHFSFKEVEPYPGYLFESQPEIPFDVVRDVEGNITIKKPSSEEDFPKDTLFTQKKVRFTVAAVLANDHASFVAGVGFKLYVNNQGTLSEFPATYYKTDPQEGTSNVNKTLGDKRITVTLTKEGYQNLQLIGGWKPLILRWDTSAPKGYFYDPNSNDATVFTDQGKPQDALVTLSPWYFSVGAGVDGAAPYIGGVTFILKDGAGTEIPKNYYSSNSTADSSLKKITLTKEGAERVRTTGGLSIVGDKGAGEFVIKGAYSSSVAHDGTYIIPLQKVDKGTGTVSVAKYTKVKDGSWYYIPEDSNKKMSPRSYYVTAFTDAALTNPARNQKDEVISGRMEIPYSWYTSESDNSSARRATLQDLTVGETYYLAETTDATGSSVVATDNNLLKIQFSGGATSEVNNAAVTVPSKDAVVPVDLTNTYDKKGLTSAKFQIKLDVVDANNKALPSTLTATFEVHASNKTVLRPARTIKLANESTKILSNVSYRWNATLYPKLNVVAKLTSLKDSSGAEVMKNYNLVNPNKNYAILARGTAITDYTAKKYYKTILPEQENQVTLSYTLKKVESEKEVAELKLTKAVTYKKTPIRVNGTYYFGIFEDAAHKKILYKKAMPLSNASSMTSTLKINLYKLAAPHTITLYFAEVDKNGKVVQSGKKTGYNITLNKTQVTLSPTHADESIILTNDVLQGSVAAANLTNPNSGFAGDASALAEAQALSNDDSTKSKPTGDDTPFEPFALATGISAAIIFLLLALLVARKKLWIKK